MGYDYEIMGRSPRGGGSAVGSGMSAGVYVDVPSGGGVGVGVLGVVVESRVAEVDAYVVERTPFFLSRPLPLSTISKTNIYNN